MNRNKYFKIIAGALFISGLSGNAMAQTAKIKSAEFAIEGEKGKSASDVLEGKNYIDEAFTNVKTSNNNRMWLVRSMVYSRVFLLRGNELIAPVSAEAGYISGLSMMNFYKSSETVKAYDIETAGLEVGTTFGAIFNESGDLYASKKYDKLLEYYKVILFLYDKVVQYDTAMANNLERNKITKKTLNESYAQIANNHSDIKIRAEVLQELADGGTITPYVVNSLAKTYLELKDTVKAEQSIREAIKKKPGDNNVFQVLVAFYVGINKVSKLMDDVNTQINNSPDSRLYFTRGYLLEQDGKYDEALADYRKSYELDEFNYDACWNIGVNLMKYQSRKVYDKMPTATTAQLKTLKEDLAKLFTEAKGYLEKAAENTSYSVDDLIEINKALRDCAIELKDEAGAKTYQEKIDALKASK